MNVLEKRRNLIEIPKNLTLDLNLDLLIKFLANPLVYFGSIENCINYFILLTEVDILLKKTGK